MAALTNGVNGDVGIAYASENPGRSGFYAQRIWIVIDFLYVVLALGRWRVSKLLLLS